MNTLGGLISIFRSILIYDKLLTLNSGNKVTNILRKTAKDPCKKNKHIVLAGHYIHRFVIAHEVYFASHPEITPPSTTSTQESLVFLLPCPPHRK